jgi:hypothetical protein
VNRKPKHPLRIIASALIISLFLVACSGASSPQTETNEGSSQENQVVLPAVEVNSPVENATVSETEGDTYPAPEEKAAADSYPAPEGSTQDETASAAYPAPEEKSPQPTPRGNDLVATDPSTVSLASGQLQLVEMFAFW